MIHYFPSQFSFLFFQKIKFENFSISKNNIICAEAGFGVTI
jgi:hypothetical protein